MEEMELFSFLAMQIYKTTTELEHGERVKKMVLIRPWREPKMKQRLTFQPSLTSNHLGDASQKFTQLFTW